MKQFLGLAAYVSKHVPNATVILSPLYKLTSKNNDFVWTNEPAEAFEQFKNELLKSQGLIDRDPNKELSLVTDASLHKCAAISTHSMHAFPASFDKTPGCIYVVSIFSGSSI